MTTDRYAVFHAADGCDEEFVGVARTLRDARRLARAAERGAVMATPRALYETARAAGTP